VFPWGILERGWLVNLENLWTWSGGVEMGNFRERERDCLLKSLGGYSSFSESEMEVFW